MSIKKIGERVDSETFIPVDAGELIKDSPIETQRAVLQEVHRWGKHCGHFVITEGLERYIPIVCDPAKT